MNPYILSCCSTADLTEELFRSRDIHYTCFHFELDGKIYTDDLGKSISFPDFYQAMVDGAATKTFQINTDQFVSYFEPFLQDGKDILHLHLSSGITGVGNSAMLAKEILEEKYPERRLVIVDSLAASSGYGLLMDKLADLRDAGYSLSELEAWLSEHKLELHHWFFSTDLTFFIRGGRVSKTSGFLGNLLNICPLLNVDHEGKLIPRSKIRTKRKVIQAMVERMQTYAQNGANYNEKCYISHSACEEDALAVANLIETSFPNLNGNVQIFNIGTTIGSHTGPGTVALFFWGEKRTN